MSREFMTLGGLAAVLTMLVGTTFATTSLTAAACAVSAVVAIRNRAVDPVSVPASDLLRSGFLTLSVSLIAAIAWRLPQYASESANPILAGADSVGHAMLFACLAWWSLRPRRGHVLMLGAAMLLILAVVVAGGVRQSLVGQITLALFTSAGFLMAASVILRPQGQPDSAPAGIMPGNVFAVRSMRSKTLFSLVVASGLLTGTSLLARATSEVLPDVQKALQDGLNGTLEDLAEKIAVRGARYITGSRLGTIREHNFAAPEEIALRAYADSAPGYLRGHVFHRLEGLDWRGVRRASVRDIPPISAGTAMTRGRRSSVLKRFDLTKQNQVDSDRLSNLPSIDGRIKTVEIHNLPEKGMVVFTPLTAKWIEAAARELRFKNDRIVGGIDLTEPYVIGLTAEAARESIDPNRRQTLLGVSRSYQPLTANLARRLCRSNASAREKADAVANYFQSNFEYSIDPVTRPTGTHPLVHFLKKKHPAHCEMFASATAMILRGAGVPTRYVTGYVMNEKSVEEEYYIARNRDLHAWVEAYDDETGQWFAVESTPGRRYGSLLFDNELTDLTGLDDDSFSRFDEGESGWLTWLHGIALRSGIVQALSSAFQFAQLPFFVALLGLVWYRARLRAIGSDDPDEVACTKMLRQVDRRLRRHRLIRRRDETLHQFANRVESASQDVSEDGNQQRVSVSDELRRMANWYRGFAVARYTGKQPERLVA